MRVISGTARGTVLKAPEGLGTRPTTDRVKENLFNIIQHEIRDTSVLDLFSGSGALGVEALSRGAREAVLIDQDVKCIGIITENLKRTHLSNQARVLRLDVLGGLQQLSREGFKAGLVLMDPPYGMEWEVKVLESLQTLGVLASGAIVAVEHAADDSLPEQIGTLIAEKSRRYGKTTLTLYREGTL